MTKQKSRALVPPERVKEIRKAIQNGKDLRDQKFEPEGLAGARGRESGAENKKPSAGAQDTGQKNVNTEPTVTPPTSQGTQSAAQISAQNPGMAPHQVLLFDAVKNNDLDGVKNALFLGALHDVADSSGKKPLDYAVSLGHHDIAKCLVDAGAQVVYLAFGPHSSGSHADSGPIFEAVKQKDLRMLKILVPPKHERLDYKDDNGIYLISHAVMSGDFEIVKFLIEQKTDINICDRVGLGGVMSRRYKYRPLPLAIKSNNAAMVKLLLDHYATVKQQAGDEDNVMGLAVDAGNIDIVHLLFLDQVLHSTLLYIGQKINTHNIDNYPHAFGVPPPLLRAINNGRLDIAKLLIEHGADVDCIHMDATPLLSAIKQGRLDMVQLLVENGATIDTPWNNYNALMCAAENGHKDIVEFLLEKGADPKKRDGKNETAITKAFSNGHNDIVELFRKHVESEGSL